MNPDGYQVRYTTGKELVMPLLSWLSKPRREDKKRLEDKEALLFSWLNNETRHEERKKHRNRPD